MGETNEYEILIEEQKKEILESIIFKSSLSEMMIIREEHKNQINEFDSRIENLKKFNEQQLLDLGYRYEQIKKIKEFTRNDYSRIAVAAVYKSWITLYSNYYSGVYSYIDYDYVVEINGPTGSDYSAATGIRSGGYYQRQSSKITGVYTYGGYLNNGGNKYHHGYNTVTNGNAAVINLPYFVPSGDWLGRPLYLSRFNLRYTAKAQGNHTINNIIATTAQQRVRVSGVGFSISSGGPSLDFSLETYWNRINRIDRKTNR